MVWLFPQPQPPGGSPSLASYPFNNLNPINSLKLDLQSYKITTLALMSTNAAGPAPLSAQLLSEFTQSYPPSASKTVREFIKDQQSRSYPIEHLPHRSTVQPAPTLPPSPRRESRRDWEYGWGEPGGQPKETALVLIRGQPKSVQPQPAAEQRKRPSLVSAMKPRTSKPGTPTDPLSRAATAGSGRPPPKAFRDAANTPSGSSSPAVVARRDSQLMGTASRTQRKPGRDPSPPPLRRSRLDDQGNKENVPPSSPARKRSKPSTTTRKEATSSRKKTEVAAVTRSESSEPDPYDEVAARQFVPFPPSHVH